MRIRVEYVAQFKEAAGVPGEALELPAGASLQAVVRRVAEAHGPRLAGLLLDEAGGLRPSAVLFVGDDQVEWDEAVVLRDGDRLTLMSPLAGG